MKKQEEVLAAGTFKSKCLKLMDDVQKRRIEIVITKRGKPVAKLIPYEEKPPILFGFMKGTAKVNGDITAPINVKWNAND